MAKSKENGDNAGEVGNHRSVSFIPEIRQEIDSNFIAEGYPSAASYLMALAHIGAEVLSKAEAEPEYAEMVKDAKGYVLAHLAKSNKKKTAPAIAKRIENTAARKEAEAAKIKAGKPRKHSPAVSEAEREERRGKKSRKA